MAARIEIKKGASLSLQFSVFNDDGTAADLTAVALTAHVRDPLGNLVSALPIVRASPTGVATVSVPDTSLWPEGLLRADIKAVVAGSVLYSDTFGIMVQRSITR